MSPRDTTWETLGFYAAHNVDEALTLDPQKRTVHWLALEPEPARLQPQRQQPLLRVVQLLAGLGPGQLQRQVDVSQRGHAGSLPASRRTWNSRA